MSAARLHFPPCCRLRFGSRRLREGLVRAYSENASYATPTSVGASQVEVQSAKDYCSTLLRQYDTPSHTLMAFIPPASQTAYLAIRAFNVEVARIADTVSTPAVGAMRYQFWRDNISRAFDGTPPKQPVSILLASALAELDFRSASSAKLSKTWFMRIISEREKYGDGRPYVDLIALEKYAENTYSTLLYLTLQTLPMASVVADHIASHIGKASGMTAVLRGLPLLAFPPPPNHHSNSAPLGGTLGAQRTPQGKVMLPLDIMAETGVREEDVLRQGAQAEGLRDAVFQVATRASDHLITAREMLKNVRTGKDVGHAFEHEGEEGHWYPELEGPASKSQRHKAEVLQSFGVFMPAVATSLWLEKLQKYDFDVFREELRRRDWRLPWKAFLADRRKIF